MQQLANLRHAFTSTKSEKLLLVHDFAPIIWDLSSLPGLKAGLKLSRNTRKRVIIDDYRRIFTKCPNANKVDLLKELQSFGSALVDLRTGRPIGELTHELSKYILLAEAPIRFQFAPSQRTPRSLNVLRLDTAAANKASAKSRSKAADDLATQLAGLRDEIMNDAPKVTYKQIANAANAQGLTTTRGGLWTASSVHRALKRLGRDEQSTETD